MAMSMAGCVAGAALRALDAGARSARRWSMTRGSDIPTAFFEVLLNLANKPQQSVGRRNELENGAALDAIALECTRPVLWIGFQGLTNQMPSHMLNPSLTAGTYHLRLQGPGTCPGVFGGAMLRIDFNRLRFLVIDDN